MGMVIDGKQVKDIMVDGKLVKNVWSNDTLLWTADDFEYDFKRMVTSVRASPSIHGFVENFPVGFVGQFKIGDVIYGSDDVIEGKLRNQKGIGYPTLTDDQMEKWHLQQGEDSISVEVKFKGACLLYSKLHYVKPSYDYQEPTWDVGLEMEFIGVFNSHRERWLQVGDLVLGPEEFEVQLWKNEFTIKFKTTDVVHEIHRHTGTKIVKVWDNDPRGIETNTLGKILKVKVRYISSHTNRFFIYFYHRPDDILDYKEMEVGGIRVSLNDATKFTLKGALFEGLEVYNETEAMKLRKGISHSEREVLFKRTTATFFK